MENAHQLLKDLDNEGIRLKELIRLLEDNLSSLGANIFGYNVERLPNTSLFSFTEFKAESLLMKLDLAGFFSKFWFCMQFRKSKRKTRFKGYEYR